MKKPIFIVLSAALVAGAAYSYYATQRQGLLGAYTDSNINFGGVDTTSAESACTSTGHERLVCLANALKKTLSPELTALLQRSYTSEEAKRWSNFPPIGYPNRVGPTLGEFTPEQLGFVKALLREASGISKNEGLDELEQILNADDYLKEKADDGAGFSSGNYHLAFLGTPAPTGTWQLYFGGHHFAFGNTFKDGQLVGATPSFRGVEPFTSFNKNGRDNAPMAQEQAAFAAMFSGLSVDEVAKAKLAQSYTDIIAGPQKDNNFPSLQEGIRVGDLSADKQALVMHAMETYVRDIAPAQADVILAKYQQQLAETFLGYSGTTTANTEGDYIRIDGPSVWIEYSIQPGRSIPGAHPHSVWRDRASDYGGNG